MSQVIPGKFATPKQKECAKKTGYVFIEPMVDPTGTKTNTASVRKAYEECVSGTSEISRGEGKMFTTKNIVIAIAVIVIAVLLWRQFKK